MPQYMLLLYGPGEDRPSPEEMTAEMPKWNAFTESLQEAGVMRAGDALHPAESATTVRVRNGETQITDGPFAETKEILGGYYLIECPDLDTALKHAARVPLVDRGSVEVRPVVDFSQIPGAEQAAAAQASR
jgi:hypothetical protein